MTDIATILTSFGGDLSECVLFDSDGPECLPYATLLDARRRDHTDLNVVVGVYQWQGNPLMFLVDAQRLTDKPHLHRIRRLLAMRGDAPYLGVVSPGQLTVYHIALDKKDVNSARIDMEDLDLASGEVLTYLGNKRPNASIAQRHWISNIVLRLLDGSITRLIELNAISDSDVISLVGRALFTRFLADRQLLPESILPASGAGGLFDTRASTEATSVWLDKTFNGHLLPMSDLVFDCLPESAYLILGDILRRAPDHQLFLGWEEKWDHLDFSHIPVGVLSQAYELYLKRHEAEKQKKEGGYYTPRLIADLMVKASLRKLELDGIGHRARILDPSAGAGVFLLTAMRELVALRWKHDGVRPDTSTLRSILRDQIVGFDINEIALRFAALGLYLLSIELDPDPQPVDKLRFDDLSESTLQLLTHDGEGTLCKLGSLGTAVGEEHKAKYDLVIGNPPWKSGTKLPNWKTVLKIVNDIAKAREINVQVPIPNEALDLPFIWRAMEWAKPGGQIAFALHAKLLFQQGDGMLVSRQALFDALDVTSIINGAELRQTKVWPEIATPFCLLFATNHRPGPAGAFRFINLRLDNALNKSGAIRLDALGADVVSTAQLRLMPELLKVLFRGTSLDLRLLEKIREKSYPTLAFFWARTFGESKGKLAFSGIGFQTLKESSRVRTTGDGLPGADASYLHGLPELTAENFHTGLLNAQELPLFRHSRIHDPRDAGRFTGPLLLVHKSIPVGTARINIAISDHSVAFNETFYGYSVATHPQSKLLSRYLTLVLGSHVALWMILLTCGGFGFEREVVEKSTIEALPIPDFNQLDETQQAEVIGLFDKLQSGKVSWEQIDVWVATLYGLTSKDLQVINDTLSFNLPFRANKEAAQQLPTADDMERFCDALRQELKPWTARFGRQFKISAIRGSSLSTWQSIQIYAGGEGQSVMQAELDGIAAVANDTAACEFVVHHSKHSLIVGRLAQCRYWSASQARLLVQRLVWSHLEFLQGSTFDSEPMDGGEQAFDSQPTDGGEQA